MAIQSAEERPAATSSGFVYITVGLVGLLFADRLAALAADGADAGGLRRRHAARTLWCLAGLYMLQPNQAAILTCSGATAAPTASAGCAGPTCSTPRPRSRCARTTSTARS